MQGEYEDVAYWIVVTKSYTFTQQGMKVENKTLIQIPLKLLKLLFSFIIHDYNKHDSYQFLSSRITRTVSSNEAISWR